MKRLLKKQSTKGNKTRKVNINYKKLIPIIVILVLLIYFVIVIYGLIKEPTNIFMVENRYDFTRRRLCSDTL